MFFGPAHSFSQYNSLPRRAINSNFQRNTPIRRSTGIPEHHIEYFVPRSISEFNLSGVGDLALPPPRRCSPTIQNTGMGFAHGLQLGPPQTLLCGPPPPPQQVQIVMKPREKMVTFEDESKGMVPPPTSSSTVTSVGATCPHGVPTTPRKSSTGIGVGVGGGGGDVFM